MVSTHTHARMHVRTHRDASEFGASAQRSDARRAHGHTAAKPRSIYTLRQHK